MRETVLKLSKREWELLKICWIKKKVLVSDVIKQIPIERKNRYQTAKMQLDRLVLKSYLNREKFGPLWVYSPKINKINTITTLITNFVNDVLDGSYMPIFINFVEAKKINPEELKEIKKMINDMPDDLLKKKS